VTGEAHTRPRISVLAVQGAVTEHEAALADVGARSCRVRSAADLEGLDGLVIPGGESTTFGLVAGESGLLDALRARVDAGLPVFGTCAGMILLADTILDGRPDQIALNAIDIVVRRNGYGRQVDSFETDVEVTGFDRPFHAVFIRAPRIERTAADVEVLARHDGDPVLVRRGNVLAASFHPELTSDDRVHRLFADMVRDASGTGNNHRQQVR